MDIEKNTEQKIVYNEIKYALDKYKSGMTVLDFPTGSGKSTAMKKYIVNQLRLLWFQADKENTNYPLFPCIRALFFIAPLNNNIRFLNCSNLKIEWLSINNSITKPEETDYKEVTQSFQKELHLELNPFYFEKLKLIATKYGKKWTVRAITEVKKGAYKRNTLKKIQEVLNSWIEKFINHYVIELKANKESFETGIEQIGGSQECIKKLQKYFIYLEDEYELKQDIYKIADDAARKKEQETTKSENRKKQLTQELNSDVQNEIIRAATTDLQKKLREIYTKLSKSVENADNQAKNKNQALLDEFTEILYEIFPNANLEHKLIFVLNINKFLLPINPIVSNSFYFFDSSESKIKDANIIFDESDSIYHSILSSFIQQSKDLELDFKTLLINIHYYLKQSLTNSLQQAQKKAFPKPKSFYRIENLREFSNELVKKYYLDYAYKTDESLDKRGSLPAVLNDGSSLFLLNPNAVLYYAEFSPEGNKVIIHDPDTPKDKIDMSNAFQFRKLFFDGPRLIFRFIIFLDKTAEKYKYIYTKSKNKKEITQENALNTLLKVLGVPSGKTRDLLKKLCLAYHNHNYFKKGKNKRDYSFYNYGLFFGLLQNHETSHPETTDIFIYHIRNTPESFMLNLAKQAHILCLSATAFNKSSSENFSMRYLISSISSSEDSKNEFHTFNLSSLQELQNFYQKKYAPFYNNQCSIEVISTAAVGEKTKEKTLLAESNLFDLFQNQIYCHSLCSYLKNQVIPFIAESDSEYSLWRYYSLAYALYIFIQNPLLRSMLCLEMLSLSTDKTNAKYALSVVKKIKAYICADLAISPDDVIIESTVSSNFNQKTKEMKKIWHENTKKAILISTYQTTANGSNLQYLIPSNFHNLVTLLPEYNQKGEKGDQRYLEKDIDCLYLGNITYLYARVDSKSSKDERTKQLLTSLYEASKLYEEDEISNLEKRKYISISFDAYYRKHRENAPQEVPSVVKKAKGILNKENKIITQAVGRINRTFQKNQQTVIILPEDNLRHLDLDELEQLHFLDPLISAILDKAYEVCGDSYKEQVLDLCKHEQAVKFQKQHFHSVMIFRSLFFRATGKDVQDDTKANAIRDYQKAREFFAQYPTVNEKEYKLSPEIISDFYIDFGEGNQATEYGYNQNGDNYIPAVDAKQNDPLTWIIERAPVEKAERVVSAQRTQLELFAKNPIIASYFAKLHITLTWKPGRYILTPQAFAMYKGFLGELAGKCFINYVLSTLPFLPNMPKLEALDMSVFEKFDEKLGNTYIDYKAWRFGIDLNEAKFRDKMQKKKEACDKFYKNNGNILILNTRPKDIDDIDVASIYDSGRYIEIKKYLNEDGSFNIKAEEVMRSIIRNQLLGEK